MERIEYYLNGISLNDLGIVVRSSEGLLDTPDYKERKQCEWPTMHGKIIDTRRPYVEPREITLNCSWLISQGGTYNVQSAQQKVREDLLQLGQQVQLRVHFPSSVLAKPLIYNVIQDKGLTFDWKFSGNDILLSFQIKLLEPLPIKVVLKSEGRTTSVASRITMNPNGGNFDIDWGDGNVKYDITGTSSANYTHTYATPNSTAYYIVISGDVALISNLTLSNDIEQLWNLR